MEKIYEYEKIYYTKTGPKTYTCRMKKILKGTKRTGRPPTQLPDFETQIDIKNYCEQNSIREASVQYNISRYLINKIINNPELV